jgi:hypothetical protein
MTLERDVITPVNCWADDNDIEYEKVIFVTDGYPDWIYFLPNGLAVWIEYKRPGKEPNPLQQYRLDLLVARDHLAYWTDNTDVAIAILKHHLESKRVPEARCENVVIAGCRWIVP